MRQELTFPLTSRSGATRVAVVFVLWSALWVTLSDYALRAIHGSPPYFWRLQGEKCLFYMVVSAAFLFLVFRATKKHMVTQQATIESEVCLVKAPRDFLIVGWDGDKRVRYVSEALCGMLGYRREELLGKDLSKLFFGKSEVAIGQLRARGGAHRTELVRRNGTPIPVLSSVAVPEEPNEHVAFFVDISQLIENEQERLQSQERILHSERTSAIAQLAGGVAHNFNNELAVMVGYASLINARPDSNERARRCAAEVLKAAERARKLVKQLLAFSCKQPLNQQTVDMNRTIEEMRATLDLVLGEDIELRLNVSRKEEWVELDLAQFQQALINLAVNARDAMPEGGRLTIEVGHRRRESVDFRGVWSGECVTVRISDTGIGMDELTQARAFEPFFTTKHITGAAGLGLATVQRIVKQNGGDISLTSHLNAGSSFTLRFPKAQEKAAAQVVRMPGPKRLPMEGTVLLVEDLDPLREMMNEILRAEGLTVLPARDGLHAVELSRNSGTIDLVLTDVVMPRMSGPEAVRLIRELHPEIKVIYSSGYTDLVDSAEGDPIIWKPVRPETLIKTVHECLLGGPAPEDENSLAS